MEKVETLFAETHWETDTKKLVNRCVAINETTFFSKSTSNVAYGGTVQWES